MTMRKLIMVLCLFLLVCCRADEVIAEMLRMGGGVAATSNCATSLWSCTNYSGTSTSQRTDSEHYNGLIFTVSSPSTVCKVKFVVNATGTISGYSYTARIWSLSTLTLNAELDVSDSITGNNSWSSSDVEFTFSSPVSLSAGTYAVTFDTGTYDVNNYISIHYGNICTGAHLAKWKVDKSIADDFTTLSAKGSITIQ